MKSSSVPASVSSSTAAARACICSVLSRPLDRETGVGHLLPDPGGLADLDLRLGGRVLRLDRLLLRPERLDLRGEPLLGLDQLLLLGLELGALLVEGLKLGLDGCLALERSPREVVASRGERLAGLALELGDLALRLRALEIDPLLRGDDVGDALLDVDEQLALLLVGVVERDREVLGTIEQLRSEP